MGGMWPIAILLLASRLPLGSPTHFRLTTIHFEPYYFDVPAANGGIQKGGYIVDLVEKLSTELNFTYSFHEVADGEYGAIKSENGTERWVGMIGEVVRGDADIAAADLTVTPLRSKVVTFSMPFLGADLGLIYQKRVNEFDWWTFVLPFTWQVWMMTIAALVATSGILFLIGTLDQDESDLRTLSGCVYFSVACLLSQGPETYPKSVSTRLLATSWWFLCLMLLVLYTADLTSTLTIDKGELPVEKIEDLLSFPDVSFGLTRDTAIQEAFKHTEYLPFQMMWQRMRSFPDEFLVGSWAEGMQRARTDPNFVFIDESPYLEYEVGQAPCTLSVVSGSRSPKTGGGFALALSLGNHEWADRLNQRIVHYHVNGFLAELHRTWYLLRSPCSTHGNIGPGNIDIQKTKGVFLLFGIGAALSVASFALKFVAARVTNYMEENPKWSTKINKINVRKISRPADANAQPYHLQNL